MRIIHYFIFLLIISVLYSCKREDNADLIRKAEQVMYIRPDSANLVLDKIKHPDRLEDKLRADYNRIKTIYLINIQKNWSLADSFMQKLKVKTN